MSSTSKENATIENTDQINKEVEICVNYIDTPDNIQEIPCNHVWIVRSHPIHPYSMMVCDICNLTL